MTPVVVLVLVALLALTGFGSCTRASRGSMPITKPDEIRKTVSRISQIAGLSPFKHEPEWDPHAVAIIALGREAGPNLVLMITDTSKSGVADLFQYTIGDVALVLLDRIYSPPTWPFPDNSEQIPKQFSDYRDYVEFLNQPGTRVRLRRSWNRYVAKYNE